MWDHLSWLHSVLNDPWLVYGDFNEAMWQHEHFSRSMRAESQMVAFRDVLTDCELWVLGFHGAPFTYDNGQRGNSNVRVRLDHACADEAWKELFPYARVVHLASSRSDHLPVVMQPTPEVNDQRCRVCPRYEIMWERDPSLPDVVAHAWASKRHDGDLGTVAASL
jgi:hypothetical protein